MILAQVPGGLATSCPTAVWQTELGYLADEIAKQSVGGVSWLPLAAQSKMQEETDKWREELASKREPGLDNLGNSQPIQIAKNAKIRRFTKESGLWRERRVWPALG